MESSKDNEAHRIASLGNDVIALKTALLGQIEKLEVALRAAEFHASAEIRRSDELRQEADQKVTRLEALLKQNEDLVQSKEANFQRFEESLTAEIQDLTNHLSEKDRLLEQRDTELSGLKSQAVAEDKLSEIHEDQEIDSVTIGGRLEGPSNDQGEVLEHRGQLGSNLASESEVTTVLSATNLQEREEALHTKESTMERLEESLNAEIMDLEDRLNESQDLSKQSNEEMARVRQQAEAAMGILADHKEVEKGLYTKIDELEQQLKVKDNVLEQRDQATSELKRQLEAAGGLLEEQKELTKNLTLKISAIEQQLREKGDALEQRDQVISELRQQVEAISGSLAEQKELARGLTIRTSELEQRSMEIDNALEQRNREVAGLKLEIEAKTRAEAQFHEREQALRKKEAIMTQLEESLNAEIRDLEEKLSTKEGQLTHQNEEISELSNKGGICPWSTGGTQRTGKRSQPENKRSRAATEGKRKRPWTA